MDELNPGFFDAVCERMKDYINKQASEGTYIPQRRYCQGAAIPDGTGKIIAFSMVNSQCFPAALAIAGQFERLVDGHGPVFTEQIHTINMRIEVFDPFAVLSPRADPLSASIVAGIRGVVRSSEHSVPKMNGLLNYLLDQDRELSGRTQKHHSFQAFARGRQTAGEVSRGMCLPRSSFARRTDRLSRKWEPSLSTPNMRSTG